ncbi:MAG TPA: hypothetical protein GX507_03575 [Clostridia bacterium]|nr:hypothetical protein [Clostridia bacterium]
MVGRLRIKWSDEIGSGGGRTGSDSVDGYYRTKWSARAGSGGRITPEYALICRHMSDQVHSALLLLQLFYCHKIHRNLLAPCIVGSVAKGVEDLPPVVGEVSDGGDEK